MGTHTPWGTSDYTEHLVPGIIWYSTSSHGGCHVAPVQNAQIHEAWRRTDGWYEEDCDWAIVAYHFPSAFPKAGEHEHALQTLRDWHPQEYMKVTGIALGPEDSYMLSERSAGFRAWRDGHRQD